jgi:hypothetical protein
VIAISAHAIGIVSFRGDGTPASALNLPADESPSEATATAIASAEVLPFAVEFITLPKAGAKAPVVPPAAARTKKVKRVPERSQAPRQAQQPPKSSSHQITRETAPPTGLLQRHEKETTKPKPGGGFSLAMRPHNRPGQGGRTGSLIDEAIASAALPSGRGPARSDLIVTEPRIGLDSHATRTTRWRDSGGGSMTSVGEPFTADIDSDGTIHFKDNDNVNARIVRWGGIPMPMIAGGFDATDAAMAAFGEVLYPFRKLKAMDQTREFRASLAIRARGKSLQSALRRFRRDLKKLWGDSTMSMKERRAMLFALWDECAEVGPDEVLKTAASIRAMVIRFVVKSLPESSSHAFTPEELTALNAQRQSSQRFAPYDN